MYTTPYTLLVLLAYHIPYMVKKMVRLTSWVYPSDKAQIAKDAKKNKVSESEIIRDLIAQHYAKNN
jgi:protocatechuate 3,4-dioxygenase beta subunit